ncbi:MAG: carboxylesterase family protein [Firmicutes bacterium]|nr:carboxylesterase family protein [Bacillota bacterium]
MNIIESRNGKLQGIQMDGYTLYKGIPFAKAPVGKLRFEAPEPLDYWEGIKDCTKWPNKAMQFDFEDPNEFYYGEFYFNEEYNVEKSEDCLYLNLWLPDNAKNCPIAMYIHGGAFDHGYASEMEFDGEAFTKKGIILASIQYRVGVFGFLAHPSLSKTSGNNGILDQIMALNWLYDNASCFGGNPENITVFGQSAGCMSTHTLCATELTENKISKAILQSASGYKGGLCSDYPLEEAYKVGEYYFHLLGISSKEELKSLDSETLFKTQLQMQAELAQQGNGLPFHPVIDGIVLKDGYNALLEQGKLKRIPYMLGSVEDEIDKMPPFQSEHPCEEGVINWSLKLEEIWNEPSFVYYFKHRFKPDNFGAYHSSELWYMFSTYKRSQRPYDESDEKLAEEMVSAWTDFMKTGNPGWKPCDQKNRFVKEFE